MYQIYFEDLSARMYPVMLYHSYGVNGKISGSVSAVGEMGGGVIAVLHGPMGCAYHYRYSARRRHHPFYDLLSSDLTEREIILGGESKLRETVIGAWKRYKPRLIVIIPTPVSDILNEDIRAVTESLRQDGINVAGIESELFSHRDKNYASRRMREIANRKITDSQASEIELKGCGFMETLYALAEQVMQPQEKNPLSVNIETIGWGGEGRLILWEMAEFLSRSGITVNCWIPSADVGALEKAPSAGLNIVRRIRWARRMKELYGTDYLHLGDGGRYIGLDGVAQLNRDIGKRLGIEEEMEREVENALSETREQTAGARAELSRYNCALICRMPHAAPFALRLYARDYGVGIGTLCLIVPPGMHRSFDITPEVMVRLRSRVYDAVKLYSPGTRVVIDPGRSELCDIFAASDAVIGANDFTLEGLGAPVIPAGNEIMSLSFPSHVRNVERLLKHLKIRRECDCLLLNRMPFGAEHFPRYENRDSIAAREMWQRMWLDRKGENV